MSEQTTIRGHILVAEDDAATRAVIVRSLERAGYEVHVAHDGSMGLGVLQHQTVDVVVSDIEMPGLDGLQFLRAIRDVDAELPVILMTGNRYTAETAMEALDRGVTDYLRKPFRTQMLLDAVERAIDDRAQAQAPATQELMALNRSFDRALASMAIHTQPIVRWSDRSIVGHECLMRPAEPELPHPGAVLDAAEKLGRLDDLGRRIRDLCAESLKAAPPDHVFFVNVHPSDLLDPELFDPAAPLTRFGSRVVLELTERARLEDIPDVGARVARLREMGFRIAIDDIGAGYSGLTSFAMLAPEILKVDMSLVRDVHRSPIKQRLIQTLVEVCSDEALVLVAEGVETTDELTALLDLGCDVFQGYLLARPGPGLPAADTGVLGDLLGTPSRK